MKALSVIALICVASLARAQSLNIDFGVLGTAPASGYAAAGLPGVWNTIGVLQSGVHAPLVRLDGSASNAKIYMIGGSAMLSADDPLTQGNDAALMDDMLIGFNDPVDVCIWVENLDPGYYEVLIYGMTPSNSSLQSRIRVDDGDPGPLMVGGAWPGSHRESVTFARHYVTTTNGVIGMHSGLYDGYIQSGMNGLQLRRITTASADPTAGASSDALAVRAFPNPAPERDVVVILANQAHAGGTLEIFAPDGRRVWSATATSLEAERAEFRWSGLDASGQSVPAGVYFVKLSLPGQAPTSIRVVRVR